MQLPPPPQRLRLLLYLNPTSITSPHPRLYAVGQSTLGGTRSDSAAPDRPTLAALPGTASAASASQLSLQQTTVRAVSPLRESDPPPLHPGSGKRGCKLVLDSLGRMVYPRDVWTGHCTRRILEETQHATMEREYDDTHELLRLVHDRESRKQGPAIIIEDLQTQ